MTTMEELIRVHWRYLRWPITCWAYLTLTLTTFGLALLPILAAFAFALVALMLDRKRDSKDNDNFKETALFYRYGKQIGYSTFSIPVNQEWNYDASTQLASDLRVGIAKGVTRLLPHAAEVASPRIVTDRDAPKEGGKDLMRIRSFTHRRSQLVHFLHFAPIGSSVTVHHFTFIRCRHRPIDEIAFLFFSPFSVWSWGLAWMQRRYSISSHLSMAPNNSFDEIDLKTLLEATNSAITNVMEGLLKDMGLLTEELHQVIVNNQTYNNQRVDLRHVRTATLGAITNLAAPVPVN